MTSPTLTETPRALGYRHEPTGTVQNGRRIVHVASGEEVGVMTAGECWEWVHERERETKGSE